MPLKVSDGIGAWIKDFQKSDAPQFKGKSKEERRDQAVAAYLSAKGGDKKEGFMPNYADKMKKKMMTPSDKDKLLKVRQMLDKEKKPVKKEAMTPAQKAAHDKAVADFKKRGGKITKLPPGKAAGYHGKDDPGSGIKGMLAKGTGTKYNIRNRGKHLDKDTSESYNHMNEDFMFKVGVEGLPDMIIGGSSPGEVKARLRKIVKQPSMITSVSRMTTAEVKKRYRDMAQGKEETNESYLNEEVPGIIRANMALAKDGIKNAIKGLTAVAGKHSDRSTKMKANKAIKTLKQAMKEID